MCPEAIIQFYWAWFLKKCTQERARENVSKLLDILSRCFEKLQCLFRDLFRSVNVDCHRIFSSFFSFKFWLRRFDVLFSFLENLLNFMNSVSYINTSANPHAVIVTTTFFFCEEQRWNGKAKGNDGLQLKVIENTFNKSHTSIYRIRRMSIGNKRQPDEQIKKAKNTRRTVEG